MPPLASPPPSPIPPLSTICSLIGTTSTGWATPRWCAGQRAAGTCIRPVLAMLRLGRRSLPMRRVSCGTWSSSSARASRCNTGRTGWTPIWTSLSWVCPPTPLGSPCASSCAIPLGASCAMSRPTRTGWRSSGQPMTSLKHCDMEASLGNPSTKIPGTSPPRP